MRLLGFGYSPYVQKVRTCLRLKKLPFDWVEVPYMDRRELVKLTGGYVHVPVLEDGGTVVTDSPRITAYLDERYAPSLRADPLAAVVEGWADGVLEDVAFRLATPGLAARFAELTGRPDAAAMFRMLKERKFGPGCVEAWDARRDALAAHVVELLAPITRAVAERPFILGAAPTLADAAVDGQLHMLEVGRPGFVRERLPGLVAWRDRLGGA